MLKFYDYITEAVTCMRDTKRFFPDVIFNHPFIESMSQIDGNTTVIFHDEALLPHWHEVAQACKLLLSFLSYIVAVRVCKHIISRAELTRFFLLSSLDSGNTLREAKEGATKERARG